MLESLLVLWTAYIRVYTLCLFLLFLLQSGYYKSVNAMAKDIELLAKNAKTYNEPGSQVFKVSE